jgi:hypothetical protein
VDLDIATWGVRSVQVEMLFVVGCGVESVMVVQMSLLDSAISRMLVCELHNNRNDAMEKYWCK